MDRNTAHREQRIVAAITELSDVDARPLDEKRYLDLLARHSVALLDADAAAVLIADQGGRLRLAAATEENARRSTLVQLGGHDGPIVASFLCRVAESLPDVRAAERWAEFCAAALDAGFAAVHPIPMRQRDTVLGVLTLYRYTPGPLTDDDGGLAAALAGLATAHLLAGRELARTGTLADQLQAALRSRIVIEQAKGIIAERHGVEIDQAFDMLRVFARHHRRRLEHVAREVVQRARAADRIEPKTSEPTAR